LAWHCAFGFKQKQGGDLSPPMQKPDRGHAPVLQLQLACRVRLRGSCSGFLRFDFNRFYRPRPYVPGIAAQGLGGLS